MPQLKPPTKNMVNRRTYTSIALVLLIFPLGEIWHLSSQEKVNYWLKDGFDFPIEGWWYYKLLCENIAWVLAAYVMVRLSKMRQWLEMVCLMHLLYRLYNLGAFLYNFNAHDDYVLAYSGAGFITAIVYFFKYVWKKQRVRKKITKREKLLYQ
jgi:hypothetical protein